MKTKHSRFGILGFLLGFTVGSFIFSYLDCGSIWSAIWSVILGVVSNKATDFIDSYIRKKNYYIKTSTTGGSVEVHAFLKSTSSSRDGIDTLQKGLQKNPS